MTSGKKWVLGLGIAAAVAGAAWFAAARWLPTDKEIAALVAAKATERLGVAVTVGSAHWVLLPWPAVVINDVRTRQEQPVVIGEFTARFRIRGLLDGEPTLERITVRDAALPRESLSAFRGKLGTDDSMPLDRLVFRNVTWFSVGGTPLAYDGDIDFDADGRPRHAELRRPGVKPPFTLTARREGSADRWQARIHVGGGTMHGDLWIEPAANGAMRLRGRLAPRDIDVSSMMNTFNRRSLIGGKGSGRTDVSAEGKTAGDLLRTLHTQTEFSVSPATVLRFDLDKAISTMGKERDGQTSLDEVTGKLDTQNTEDGMRTTYSGLKARSDKYSAAGEATVYRRQIEASCTLFLEESKIRVPFTVSGPVENPKTTVAPGALAGAVIGRAGARIGNALRRIFKGDDD